MATRGRGSEFTDEDRVEFLDRYLASPVNACSTLRQQMGIAPVTPALWAKRIYGESLRLLRQQAWHGRQ